jgi:hypothetical protein
MYSDIFWMAAMIVVLDSRIANSRNCATINLNLGMNQDLGTIKDAAPLLGMVNALL